MRGQKARGAIISARSASDSLFKRWRLNPAPLHAAAAQREPPVQPAAFLCACDKEARCWTRMEAFATGRPPALKMWVPGRIAQLVEQLTLNQ